MNIRGFLAGAFMLVILSCIGPKLTYGQGDAMLDIDPMDETIAVFEIKSAGVRDAVEQLFQDTGLNVIVSPQVRGTVTVSPPLRNLTRRNLSWDLC